MTILQNVSLKPYNTFGMDVAATHFTVFNNLQQLPELSSMAWMYPKKYIIGGGSNILLTQPLEGVVIKNEWKGIALVDENDEHVWLQVNAGEIWHDTVLYAISKGWGGMENLSLIPGCVGAAPMQNIGAYGVEVKELIDEVVAWHWEENRFIALKNEDCQFGYRDSIFKQALKEKVLITSVVFRLNKKPKLNTTYGAIQQQLEKMGVHEPTIKSVSDAVIAIRTSKLPNPKDIGNAGSFFKNPVIPKAQFLSLQQQYPTIVGHASGDNTIKVAAGWLIEQAGWKGYKKGAAGVHDKQALVLVNHGGASGMDVYDLSRDIITSVHYQFGIMLEREVQIW